MYRCVNDKCNSEPTLVNFSSLRETHVRVLLSGKNFDKMVEKMMDAGFRPYYKYGGIEDKKAILEGKKDQMLYAFQDNWYGTNKVTYKAVTSDEYFFN